MSLIDLLVLVSSFSFFAYGLAYFISPKMKSEFIRFGLKKYGTLTAVLEIIGALGLLIGLVFNPFLVISSLGLALLMFFGVAVRIKIKDPFFALLPALFYLLLNLFIFIEAVGI